MHHQVNNMRGLSRQTKLCQGKIGKPWPVHVALPWEETEYGKLMKHKDRFE